MDRIMHSAIAEIPYYKAGEKHESMAAQSQVHQSKYYRGNDKTGHGRHEKPLLIARKSMVITM